MKEIVVVSGKGGTGKTTLLAYLASRIPRIVMADCDVDAPNLHLMLRPEIQREEDFNGMRVATIDSSKCTNCGKCIPVCRFGAAKRIGISNMKKIAIDQDACEGCALCSRICPSDAVRMVDKKVGRWFVSRTAHGTMVHALLDPGAENSGKLVAMVKQNARMVAAEEGADIVLVDGPPGIGCPVISSLSGASIVVVVSEPTESGLSDLKRVVGLARGFGLETVLVTNKADLNEDLTTKLEEFAMSTGVRLVGRIPYDEALARAMAKGELLPWDHDCPAVGAMSAVHDNIVSVLRGP